MNNKNAIILSVFGVLIIIFILLVNQHNFNSVESIFLKNSEKQLLTQTSFASLQMEQHIKQTIEDLDTLSKVSDIELSNKKNCKTGKVHKNARSSVLKVNNIGDIVGCSGVNVADYIGINIKNKNYFKQPRDTGEIYINSQKQGSSNQITISYPQYRLQEFGSIKSSEFLGELIGIIEVRNLVRLYIAPIISKNNFILFDEDNKEIIDTSFDEIKINLTKLNKNKRGTWFVDETIENLGKTIITSSNIFFGSKTWRLYLFTPKKVVLSPVLYANNKQLISISLTFVIFIIIIFYATLNSRKRMNAEKKLKKAKITLEKLGINSEREKQTFSLAETKLKEGYIYLVKEDGENHAHELFLSLLNNEFIGLGVIREEPTIFKERYNLKKTSFIQLTTKKSDKNNSETNIDKIKEVIVEFLERNKRATILVDRIDYLIAHNTFLNVIKAIHTIKDVAKDKRAIVILGLNPKILQSHELTSLEAETVDLYGKDLKKNVSLTKLEFGILSLINTCNSQNKIVSFKDITTKFAITKPTTRKKIKSLENLKLITVEQKGRFKSLKITSAGRRILM